MTADVRFVTSYETATSFFREVPPALAEAGLDVEVLLSAAEYRDGRAPLEDEIGDTVRVRRLGRPSSVAASGRVLPLLRVALVAPLVMLFGPAVRCNVFFSTPPLFASIGMLLRLVRRQPYVCVVMDVYPDVLVESGIIGRRGAAARLTRRLMAATWRRAAAVIVIGRCMHERLRAAGVPAERLHLIPNWPYDGVQRLPRQPNAFRTELGLDDELVVLYAGNLGVSHTFDEVLAVASELHDRPDVHFVFAGAGSRRREIEAAVASGSANISLLPFQDEDRLSELLALADVHLVTLRSAFTGVVVPSKGYGSLASGRPLILVGDADGELAQLILSADAGHVVAPGNSMELRRVIEGCAADTKLRDRQGTNAARAVDAGEHRDRCIRAYVDLLRSVASQHGVVGGPP